MEDTLCSSRLGNSMRPCWCVADKEEGGVVLHGWEYREEGGTGDL
jgi:hypothetical protein